MSTENTPLTTESDGIVVTYTETRFDREFTDDDGTVSVDGLPYRAEYDGLSAAATSPEGALLMIQRMLNRRAERLSTPPGERTEGGDES